MAQAALLVRVRAPLPAVFAAQLVASAVRDEPRCSSVASCVAGLVRGRVAKDELRCEKAAMTCTKKEKELANAPVP